MNIDAETGKKIQELQVFEQNLQAILMQKQAFQSEMSEVSTASEEVKKSKEDIYRIIGGIMLKAGRPEIEKELAERKKILEMRISSIEKQEKIVDEKAESLRKEISDSLTKKSAASK